MEINANFSNMEEVANEIRGKGRNVNESLREVYNIVNTKIREAWHGWGIYNDVIEPINEMVVNVNKMINLTTNIMPQALEGIVTNYRVGGRTGGETKIGGNINDDVTAIEAEPVFDSDTKHYDSEQILNGKNQILEVLDNAITSMDEYQKSFNSVNWDGPTATTFQSTYDDLKASVNNALKEIQDQLDGIINAAKTDFDNVDAETRKSIQM